MAKAVQVRGTYPNLSEGEVFYSGFSLNADKRYVIGVTISPALAAGGELDLDLPLLDRTFTFTGAGGTTPATVAHREHHRSGLPPGPGTAEEPWPSCSRMSP